MQAINSTQIFSAEKNQLVKHAVRVHKFGGSSLATAQCIERVVAIIQSHCQLTDIIVVSANGNTTDALFKIVQQVENEGHILVTAITQLQENQQRLIQALLNENSANLLIEKLIKDIAQLSLWLTEDLVSHQNDILAFGELWSARLLSAVLSERVCPSYCLDARHFLVIDDERQCQVLYRESELLLKEKLQSGKLAVITGYICQDRSNNTRTLGRNGSDYSATIMASLLGASNVILWTDVDGIYSADPRIVPTARKLHRLPNGVAKELGRLGNPVLHAKTLIPLTNHSTHLHVASSFDPSISGTEIGSFGQIAKQELSVTYLNDLLLAHSTSFLGELGKGIVEEFLAICFDAAKGFIVIHQHQQKALSQCLACHDTQVSFTPVSIVATVGHHVVKHGDVKARFTRSLKHNPPLEIVNSSNNHSLIAILAQPCSSELLNSVHHDMTKDARHIGLVVAGLGNIGQRFLEILPEQLSRVSVLENVYLVGLVTSKKALINTDGIEVRLASQQYHDKAQVYDKELLLSWLANHPYDELIVVDNTPSEQFSLLYNDFFEQGIHVIGANKWAASSSPENYQKLLDCAAKNNSIWLGNTTVGAGLPINHTIQDLRNSGDSIREVSGVFSGTLSWLFASYDSSVTFSTLLIEALSQGITEPDPREDLSGRDVQRKLLILARLAGFNLSLADIDCQNLVPKTLQTITINEFLQQASALDNYFADAYHRARANNNCIRYLASFTVNNQKISAKVSLESLPDNHAFANLTPCDNIFQIKSQWYQDNPLIIRGPGAGRDVTAGGLHSDLVNICQQLITRQTQVKLSEIN